jgi:hypothetical protein
MIPNRAFIVGRNVLLCLPMRWRAAVLLCLIIPAKELIGAANRPTDA